MPVVYRELEEWLDERQNRFIAISDEIWANPELALAEFKACQLQADSLAADGFTITRSVGGLPTAFMAEFTQGKAVRRSDSSVNTTRCPGFRKKNHPFNCRSSRTAPVMAAGTICSVPLRSRRP